MKDDCPVLIIEDQEPIIVGYKVALSREGITNVVTCSDGRDAIKLFRRHSPCLVLLDLIMPNVRGEDILVELSEKHSEVPVIVLTGNDDIESAVRCMKSGAYDYLVKPVSRERLISTVKRALSYHHLERENEELRAKLVAPKLEHPEVFQTIITKNAGMKALFSYIEATAATSHPFLITGETGVGKELFARAVHDASGRKGRFVAVNVSGLDDNVVADTLFGHRKGAFTGAASDRAGMVEEAAGGSIFLDEIGDLSMASQVKLLRLLQENEYLPLGQDKPVRSTARVIVATNADLSALQETGKFRADLYYRLNTHSIHVPPIRERREDLGLLVDKFVEESARSMNKKRPTVPGQLLSLLSDYRFPGNIRELKAMVADAVSRHESRVMSLDSFKQYLKKHAGSEDDVTASVIIDAGPGLSGSGPIFFGPEMPLLKDAKRYFVEEALKRTGGNLTRAADLLGTTRQALSWYKKG